MIALATLLGAVVVIAVTGFVAARRGAEDQAGDHALELVRTMSGLLVDDVYRLDVHALRLRLGALRAMAGVREAYVTDAEGIVLADGTTENGRRDQTLGDSFGTALLLSRTWMWSLSDGTLRAGGPILAADGALLGYLTVSFGGTRPAATGGVTMRLFGAALLSVLLGGVILWRSLSPATAAGARNAGFLGGDPVAEERHHLEYQRAAIAAEKRRLQEEMEAIRAEVSRAGLGGETTGRDARQPEMPVTALEAELAHLRAQLTDAEQRRVDHAAEAERAQRVWVAERETVENERRRVQDALSAAGREIEETRAQVRALRERAADADELAHRLRQAEDAQIDGQATIELLQKERAGLNEDLARALREKEVLERALREIREEHAREQEVLDQLQAATMLPEDPFLMPGKIGGSGGAGSEEPG